MQVFRSISSAGALRGCAVAIGNFDGVHLGHRRLFELTREQASASGGKAVALTFEPHPVRVLRPQLAPPLITPLPRKLELFADCGLDAAVVQAFDLEYARSDATDFVGRDLAGGLGAADVVVGHDFTAGRARTRVDGLRQLLAARGILLLEGNVEGAAQLLCRPHDVDGAIEPGARRGRSFGFATANVRAEAILPANGVYAIRARLGAAWYDGVCNVGVKPTVQRAGPVTPEAHLFDFDGRDLYGERIRLAFVARLREERRFPSIDALRAQIAADAERARTILREAAPHHSE